MLTMLEGPPRAGKSYTAVKEHILPAIKAGRRVYARLNGLDHEKIAAHLQLPVERVRELLILLEHDQVVPMLTAFGDNPPKFQVLPDSLVVVDEVHDFYVSGRQALPKEQEAFFAKHGHIGLDVVMMTQALGRLHSAIRQRIERKYMFAKQNALGRESKYTVRFYAVGDTMGKFEKIGSETRDYEPVYFPLYHGFQPGTENTQAYSADTKTVWDMIKKPAIAVSLAVLVGVFALAKFFMQDGDDIAAGAKGKQAQQEPAKPAPAPAPRAVVNTGASTITAPPKPPQRKLSPGVDYVVQMVRTARPRYLGVFEGGRGEQIVVEFRATQGQAFERLTGDQLRALGWDIERTAYGALAKAEGESIVFTQWPIDILFTQSSVTTARIQSAATSSPGPATAQPTTAAPTQGSVISTEGSL